MASLNSVHLIGNVTRDPDVRSMPNGGSVCEIGLAVNRKFKTASGEEREDVLFVDVTFFGKSAEVVGQWVKKGKLLFVDGRLRQEVWEDKTSGQKRSKITVVAENFQFLGGRDDGGGQSDSGEQRQEQRPASRPAQQRGPSPRTGSGGRPAQKPQEPPFGDEQSFAPDDIPFFWEGRSGQIL